MKTIVKGKIQETKYNFNYSISYIEMKDYLLMNYCNYTNEQKLERSQHKKETLLNYVESDYIYKSNSIIDYETFYTSNELTYTLNVGNMLFIEENGYKVEKVEGLDDNTVIYYVDNILRIEEDLMSYKKALNEFEEYKNKRLTEIEKDIEYYQKQIEAENNVKNIEKEIDRPTEKIIEKKKWYQFLR